MITAREVRLISADGKQLGVVNIRQAIFKAQEAQLDLVEISPNAFPPVVKIMDYGKYKYQESKRKHEAKLRQKFVQIKEIKFRPGTDEGDYQVKLRSAKRFLSDGDKVKVSLLFRGREMLHQKIGLEMLQRVEDDLSVNEDLATVEQKPKLEGRQMVMVLSPKKK